MKSQKQFRIYGKPPKGTRFAAMDWHRGCQSKNLMFATIFSASEAAKIRAELPELHKQNNGWSFELRAIKGSF